MRGKKAKAIRRAVYQGVENHGFKCTDRDYQNANGFGGKFHLSKIIAQDPENGKWFTSWVGEVLLADRFRAMYQQVKREYTRGVGDWGVFLGTQC